MENKYDVIISEKAKQQLVLHSRFLANINEQAANRLIASFIEKAYSLENMPQRNPIAKEIVFKSKIYYKMILEKRYMLLYQIENNTVYIDYVIDTRQDYQWLIESSI